MMNSRLGIAVCCFAYWLVTMSLLLLAKDELRYPSADTTSYIDIAMNARSGNYWAFSNPYWSPLYPALIYLALPSDPAQALSQQRMLFLQGILLTGMIASFAYFLTGISRIRLNRGIGTMVLGIVSFLFFLAYHVKMYLVTYTPDTLIAIVVFCALGLICRLLWLERNIRLNMLLGIVLAAGYWAKAVYFPASILLLVLLLLTRWKAKLPVLPTLFAAGVFMLLSAPMILMTSIAAGRPTFGESGNLNYGWSVNRYEMHMGWHGKEPGSGIPSHPPRILSEKPLVLEFAEPGAGSFPIWYDPTLWHKGMRTHFSGPQILAALKRNLSGIGRPVFFWLLLAMPAFLLGGALVDSSRRLLTGYSCLWLWPLAVVASYCFVAVETRYLAPLVVASVVSLLWLCPVETSFARTVFGLQMIAIAAASLWMLYTCLPGRPRSDVLDSRWSYERTLAEYLSSHGVRRGDSLANVGEIDSVLFAQPVGAQVVSWIKKPKADELTPGKWASILNQWRSMKIAAVVSKCRDEHDSIDSIAAGSASCSPPLASSLGLERVPGTPYFVKMLAGQNPQ